MSGTQELERVKGTKFYALKSVLMGAEEVWLGYNANGDLVEIRKRIGNISYKRAVKLAGVTDFTVASWDKFEGWSEV